MGIREEKNAFIAGKLTALAAQGLSSIEAAKSLDISYAALRIQARKHKIRFSKKYKNKHGAENEQRAAIMASRYKSGETLQSIAFDFGLTRERVRQILALTKGMDATDGGKFVASINRKNAIRRRKDEASLSRWGCSYDDYRSLVAIGKEMMKRGESRERTPRGAFTCQKRNAFARGIEWHLTLWQWWTIWQESGRWEDRGRGHGYVMCRKGDVGPYAADNVFIAPAHFNTSSGNKKSDLPIGVIERKGRFLAKISINGEKISLGVFPTPEEAHHAYLTALSVASPARGVAA